MLFNSIQYMIFLPVFFLIYWKINNRYRNVFILIASYFFYMCWNVRYGVLIFAISMLAYVVACFMEKDKCRKKIYLVLGICFTVGVLGYFKYFNFLLGSIYGIANMVSIPVVQRYYDIVLPVGISFFSFQAMAYMIDCYRGEIKAEKNIIDFLAYISFFPQLVAGPIERTKNLMPQMKAEKHFDYGKASAGMKIMMVGFFKKLVVADTLSTYVDVVFGQILNYKGFTLVIAVFFFTFQIYCDFSGYSDIAIGSAKILGIDLMDNFKSPYFSRSLREFWARWHISLSTWFRDYVYIPLGGNRKGRVRRNVNVMVTFLLSGLWHGADWSYVIWGGVHGLGQIVSNVLYRKDRKKLPAFVGIVFTFLFCMIGWVFFRAANIGDAAYWFSNCLAGIGDPVQYITEGVAAIDRMNGTLVLISVIFSLFILLIIDIISYRYGYVEWINKRTAAVRYLIYAGMLVITIFLQASETATFVYFQF